jgi:probable rRNA maturation factor
VRVRGSAQRIEIELALSCRAWRKALPDAAALAEEAARAALAAAKPRLASVVEVTLVLGDDALVRALNRRWRRRDAATNVLSFATGEIAAPDRPQLLGDVVLAYETVAREAAAQGKTLADHLRHLVAHGVLHLLGWDHEGDAEAARMEALERRILRRLGVADPYREREHADG